MKKIHKRSNSDANRSIFARSKRWSSDAITKDIKDEDTDLAMSVNGFK